VLENEHEGKIFLTYCQVDNPREDADPSADYLEIISKGLNENKISDNRYTDQLLKCIEMLKNSGIKDEKYYKSDKTNLEPVLTKLNLYRILYTLLILEKS